MGSTESRVSSCYVAPCIEQSSYSNHVRFAYVDFATPELQQQALKMSETLLDGRKVLIKLGM